MICVLIVGLVRLRVMFNSVVHGYYVFVVGGLLVLLFSGWVWWVCYLGLVVCCLF